MLGYLQDLAGGSKKLYRCVAEKQTRPLSMDSFCRIKLMLVGVENVGKTTLAKLLAASWGGKSIHSVYCVILAISLYSCLVPTYWRHFIHGWNWHYHYYISFRQYVWKTHKISFREYSRGSSFLWFWRYWWQHLTVLFCVFWLYRPRLVLYYPPVLPICEINLLGRLPRDFIIRGTTALASLHYLTLF